MYRTILYPSILYPRIYYMYHVKQCQGSIVQSNKWTILDSLGNIFEI